MPPEATPKAQLAVDGVCAAGAVSPELLLRNFIASSSPASLALLNPRLPESISSRLTQLLAERAACAGHVWFASSGSTASHPGDIKLVGLARAALLASAHAVNLHLQSTAADCWLQPLPSFHVGGAGIWARAFLSGARVVDAYALWQAKWSPASFQKLVEQHAVTLSALVPTQVYDLVELQLQAPSSLRAIIVGGGYLAPALYRSARALGWPLLPSYGLTECASQVATAGLASLREPADGLSLPRAPFLRHVEVISQPDGRAIIQSPALLTAYAYWSAQNTPSTLRLHDPKSSLGFLTDDCLEFDATGLFGVKRMDDCIKIGGESVSLARLEHLWQNAAMQHNVALQRSSLLALPDARLGRIIALVVEEPESAAWHSAITSYQAAVLPFERFRSIFYDHPLVRSSMGKVLKSAVIATLVDQRNV